MRKPAEKSVEPIERGILFVRGQKVMLDADLAALYGIETRILVQAVQRNLERFPGDFMFRLSNQQLRRLRSQSVISSERPLGLASWGGRRTAPYAFTEQGVAMLSSVLKSPRAIAVNIEIMRTFVRLRRMLTEHKELARRLDELEAKYDQQFKVVFDAIRELMQPPTPQKRPIGFVTPAGK